MGEFSLEYHVGLQNLISVKTNPVTRWNIDVGQFSTTADYVLFLLYLCGNKRMVNG